jgi:GntR family transcriptional regulator, transcriptional repressor for pyruvate dehydrogenase complex
VGDLFPPLNDYPAYRQIANLIEQRILDRSLRTGDALRSESDLARQFGVNRSTVREAIRELEIQGLLGRARGAKRLRVTRPEHHHISGGVSRALALHDVTFMELWEAMMAIEPAAAQYAAVRRSAEQLQALLQACAHFERDAADTEAAVAAVVEFFTAVAVASGNQVLALSQASLNALLAPTLTRMLEQVPQARGRIREAQAKITSAIKLKKSDQARSWMEKHIHDFKRGHELEHAPKTAAQR